MEYFMKYIDIAFRCALQYRNEKFSNSDLNGNQCIYINHICKNPGISQDKLSKIMYINKSSVTRQLANLEESGYVTRKIYDDDKRVINVFPTQKALDVLPAITKTLHDWNDYVAADFTEEETEVLCKLLERITDKSKLYIKKGSKIKENEEGIK